ESSHHSEIERPGNPAGGSTVGVVQVLVLPLRNLRLAVQLGGHQGILAAVKPEQVNVAVVRMIVVMEQNFPIVVSGYIPLSGLPRQKRLAIADHSGALLTGSQPTRWDTPETSRAASEATVPASAGESRLAFQTSAGNM